MLKITMKIDGMMCGMCESHVNDAVRKVFPVKKVTSSRSKGETVILTETDILESSFAQPLSLPAIVCWQSAKRITRRKGYSAFGNNRPDGCKSDVICSFTGSVVISYYSRGNLAGNPVFAAVR